MLTAEDRQVIEQYIDTCLVFINPFVLNDILSRGLVWVVDRLPPNKDDARAEVERRITAREKQLAEATRQWEEERKEYEEQERQRKEDARNFNANLNIPVKWTLEIKPVLSGLQINSSGDGENRRTVYHILLLEDLNEGRLHRKAGEFLCSHNKGRFPDLHVWQRTGEMIRSIAKTGGFIESEVTVSMKSCQVTCKKCLQMARRWRKVDV